MNFYRDYGLLEALYADPALTSSRRHTDLLRTYLRDESISPLPFQRLAHATEHGETLLRKRKPEFYDREPRPGVSVIGDRLAGLVAAGRR
jgi:hypothetical protein